MSLSLPPPFERFDAFDDDQWGAALADLNGLRAADLISMRRVAEIGSGDLLTVFWSHVDSAHFRADESPMQPSEFLVSARSVTLHCTLLLPGSEDAEVDDDEVPAWASKILRRISARYRYRLRHTAMEFSGGARWMVAELDLPRHEPLGAAVDLAETLQRAMELRPTDVDADRVADLMDSRAYEALLGVPESQLVEAKGAPYPLSEPSARLEFAKDVAAMANGGGGVILIGFKTVQRHDQDVIDAISPCLLEMLSPAKYRGVLASLVVPHLSGVNILSRIPQDSCVSRSLRHLREPSHT